MEMPSGWWRCGGWSGLGLLGPALVLRPPPDADHVVTGHGHHVLVVKTTRHLVLDNGIRTSLSDNS